MNRKFFIYWVSISACIFFVLLGLMKMTGAFPDTEEKLNSLLSLHQQASKINMELHTEALRASTVELSKDLSKELQSFLAEEDMEFEEFNDQPEQIVKFEQRVFSYLDHTLSTTECSGVYFLLDATCNTKADRADTSRMGMYLRYSDLSGVNTTNKHLTYFRGTPEVARRQKIQMHNRWDLEVHTDRIEGYEQMMGANVIRLADQCVVTGRIGLKDTWEDVSCFAVPIMDATGKVRGICGVEMSDLYFRLSYNSSETEMGDMVLVATAVDQDLLYLEDAMISEAGSVQIEPQGTLQIRENEKYCTYDNDARHYVGKHANLSVKDAHGRQIVVASLLSKEDVQNELIREYSKLFIELFILLIMIVMISGFFLRRWFFPMTRLVRVLRKEYGEDGETKEGIEELIERVLDRSNKEEQIHIPVQVESVMQDFACAVQTLTPMEKEVFQAYMQGMSVEEVADRLCISIYTVKKHNTNINRKLHVSSRDELLLYIDLFRWYEKERELT